MENNLYLILKSNKISSKELSKKLNINEKTINAYIEGTAEISIADLLLICNVLDVNVSDVLPTIPDKHSKFINSTNINNNYYGFLDTLNYWLTQIKVVDINKIKSRLIAIFTVTIGLYILIGEVIVNVLGHTENQYVFLAHQYIVISIMLGLILPLVVRSFFSYIPLISGLAHIILLFIKSHEYIAWIIALLTCVFYTQVVKFFHTKK